MDQSSHGHDQKPTVRLPRGPTSEVTGSDRVVRAVGGTRSRQPPAKPPPYIPQLREKSQQIPSGTPLTHDK